MIDVLVPTPRDVDKDRRAVAEASSQPARFGNGVGRFQGGNDPFGRREVLQRLQGLLVGRLSQGDPTSIFEKRKLRPNPGVIEAGTDGVGFSDLSVRGLKHVALRAMEDPGPALSQ